MQVAKYLGMDHCALHILMMDQQAYQAFSPSVGFSIFYIFSFVAEMFSILLGSPVYFNGFFRKVTGGMFFQMTWCPRLWSVTRLT